MPFAPHFSVFFFAAYRTINVHNTRKSIPRINPADPPYGEMPAVETSVYADGFRIEDHLDVLGATTFERNAAPRSLRAERHIPLFARGFGHRNGKNH